MVRVINSDGNYYYHKGHKVHEGRVRRGLVFNQPIQINDIDVILDKNLLVHIGQITNKVDRWRQDINLETCSQREQDFSSLRLCRKTLQTNISLYLYCNYRIIPRKLLNFFNIFFANSMYVQYLRSNPI